LHRIALDATLIDKGMVAQGQHGERQTVLDEALGMLRVGGPTLLIVPSMAHLALSVGKLARLVEQHFGDGTFALVAVAEGVDTRTDNGRFVLHLLRTLTQWDCEGEYNGKL
jgi:DNA invertase Pin-like site-specific DNA recombinase